MYSGVCNTWVFWQLEPFSRVTQPSIGQRIPTPSTDTAEQERLLKYNAELAKEFFRMINPQNPKEE